MTASLPQHHHIHVQYWHTYHVFYDSGCILGKALQKGQRQLFDREGWGIQVDSDLLNHAMENNGNEEKVYPYFYVGTKMSDFEEAQFVVRKGAVTYNDLQLFRLGDYEAMEDGGVEFMTSEYDSDTVIENAAGSAMLTNNHSVHLTPTTKRLHKQLDQSVEDDHNASLTEEQKTDAWKTVKEMTDYVINDKLCRNCDKNKFLAAVRDARQLYVTERNERVTPTDNTGRSVFLTTSPPKGKLNPSKRLKGIAG